MSMQIEETIAEKLDTGREMAAEKLEGAAGAIREKAGYLEEGSGRVGRIADRTATGMTATADYLRSHDVSAMWDDVTRFLRRHPAESVAAALVIGLLAGRAMRAGRDV
jgi:hypothetical protein